MADATLDAKGLNCPLPILKARKALKDIADGNTVTSILTSASVHSLGLETGKKVTAIIKASSVLLAIP